MNMLYTKDQIRYLLRSFDYIDDVKMPRKGKSLTIIPAKYKVTLTIERSEHKSTYGKPLFTCDIQVEEPDDE